MSTRKVKAITEELCGHSVPASTISRINKRLDKTFTVFAGRELDEPMPYLTLDVRYEKVRESGVIRSQAVPIAIGIGGTGRWQHRDVRENRFVPWLPMAIRQRVAAGRGDRRVPGNARGAARRSASGVCATRQPTTRTCRAYARGSGQWDDADFARHTSSQIRSISWQAHHPNSACARVASPREMATSPDRRPTARPGDIENMEVVAHAGAVRGRVVAAVDLRARTPAERHLGDAWQQVRGSVPETVVSRRAILIPVIPLISTA